MLEGKCGCGLIYAVKRSGSAVGYCSLSVRCGTRAEVPETDGHDATSSKGYHSGTAHFVEHTIFKGTTKHNAAAINSCLDKLGGELNAYTTKEEIVLHATVLKEDLRKAASLLFELVTSPTFPAGEIETERGVIIDEINSYRDAPAEEVYDVFEEMLFEGHPLSGPILGKIKSVRKITPEELSRFVREQFVPANMAFTVVADIDEAELAARIERLAAKFFPSDYTKSRNPLSDNISQYTNTKNIYIDKNSENIYTNTENTPDNSEYNSLSDNTIPTEIKFNREPFNLTINRRNHQANCVIGGYAPSLYNHRDRIAMVLLTNIIGGPASNSILNASLREKRGWVYDVECTYTQYADTGIAAIALGCEKENVAKCLKAIERELGKLRDNPISEARLKAAKKQLLGQIAVSGDNGENQCLSMGKSLLAYGHVFTDIEGRRQIEAVTAADLQRLASRFFSPSILSTLIFT